MRKIRKKTDPTTAERQRRFREKMSASGMVNITVMVPAACMTDMQMIAEAMRIAPHLRPGPLRDPGSGKLVAAKQVLARVRHASEI